MHSRVLVLSMMFALAACSNGSGSGKGGGTGERAGGFGGFTAEEELAADKVWDYEKSLRPASCLDGSRSLATEVRVGDVMEEVVVSSGSGFSNRQRIRLQVESIKGDSYVVVRTPLESSVSHAVYAGPIYSGKPARTTCTPKTENGYTYWHCDEGSFELRPEVLEVIRRHSGEFEDCDSSSGPDRTTTYTKGTYAVADGKLRPALLVKSKTKGKRVCKRNGRVVFDGEIFMESTSLKVQGALVISSPFASCSGEIQSEWVETTVKGATLSTSSSTVRGIRWL